jgi:DNA-binding NtrC family response regulator
MIQGENMAMIIIMDDNRSTGVLLKRALEREEHQVRLVADLQELSKIIEDPTIDLVLIHQDDSQWTAFNQFKIMHQDIPAMLYVMRDYSLKSIVWIVKAAQEALARLNKLGDQTPLWDWDTPCNDSGISYLAQ